MVYADLIVATADKKATVEHEIKAAYNHFPIRRSCVKPPLYGLWFMVYGMFVCFGFPLSGRAVRRFGSRPSSPVTAFAGLLHGPQVSPLATVERRGAAARALPPTIPAVLFLGRNVLPSCQHRSRRNTAKGPLRREKGRLNRQAP